MKTKLLLAAAAATTALAVLGGTVVSAQAARDKYSLKVPGGLAFSEFRGYEDWAVISAGHTGELVKAIVGNPVVIDAIRAGVPCNGRSFPDWSKMAKVDWQPQRHPEAPYDFKMPRAIYGPSPPRATA